MTDQRWNELQRLFGSAIALPRPERTAFVDQACAHDPTLRQELDGLLAAHASDEQFLDAPRGHDSETIPPLDTPTSAGASRPAPADQENPSAPSVPGFRIIRELGRGGMGVVYEAQRDHPRRTVALKLLRSTLPTPTLRRRFEHEVHLLARLQHPGIAQIYDAGVAPSPHGPTPYFAMEFVRGRPLQEIVRDPSVALRTRLDLIAHIADAVQHAHQQGVIHRDLKPANILVTPDGQPKVLDFGVARATDSDLQFTTVHTEVGQLIGTLPYMSPEQVAGDPDHLDSRSDVYALGVIAYELLAGQLPYELQNKLIPEAVRVIQQAEPSRLSTVNKAYRGDIETIVAKALEKDRERRYQSAADLAADIRRFLNDEPVVARPPSRMYLVRKFAKRHRPFVMGAAAALLVLVAGAATATVLAINLAHANRTLQTALGDADLARREAQRQADSARAVNGFYTRHLLLAAAPEESLGRETTIREALDLASGRIDSELSRQLDSAAFIHLALASVFQRLNRPDQILPHSERAVELYRQSLGPNHPDTLNAISEHARHLHAAARYEEADELRASALAALRERVGDTHRYTLSAMSVQAATHLERGQWQEALPTLQHVVTTTAAAPDRDAPFLLGNRLMLAQAYELAGRIDDAETSLRTAIDEASRDLPEDHPMVMEALNGLGAVLMVKGDLEGALPIVRRLADESERILGPDHLNAMIARQNLARTLSALKRFDEAEPLWIDLIPRAAAKLPEHHPVMGMLTQSYGIALAENGRDADAIPYLVQSAAHFEATLGPDHDETQRSMEWLAGVYGRMGDETNAMAWKSRVKK